MRYLAVALGILLAGCVAEPKVIVVPAPAPSPSVPHLYPRPLDRACARFVQARTKRPTAAPDAATAGDAYCGNIQAHVGRSTKEDTAWLRSLTRQIERMPP